MLARACLFYMFTNTLYRLGRLGCYPWKQLYLIAFVDLVPAGSRKGQSYPVEYYLESVEEYSEGKIHMSEPESGNGKVNTVYFVNQTWGNTRISRTE